MVQGEDEGLEFDEHPSPCRLEVTTLLGRVSEQNFACDKVAQLC